jgi:hypothetical protein
MLPTLRSATGTAPAGVSEHFQEKWAPVFRPKMRPRKKALAASPYAWTSL